jgi:hypothetical protein
VRDTATSLPNLNDNNFLMLYWNGLRGGWRGLTRYAGRAIQNWAAQYSSALLAISVTFRWQI